MTELVYPISEWRDSLEQAEIARWDGTSNDLHGWPLSQWVCRLVADRMPVSTDTDIFQAIVNLLDDEGDYANGFSPQFFTKVLDSDNGRTDDDFEKLCWEHTEENYEPGDVGDPRPELNEMQEEDDFERWYTNNVLSENELCATADAGGTLYWFDKNKW